VTKASRAIAYVGMTRGKDENHAFIYQPITGEADHEHGRVASGAEIHTIRRGDKYAAAHYFRMILANDDRPRTMYAEAERTDRELLPPRVGALLDRNDERRATPRGGKTGPKRVRERPPTNGSPRRRGRPQNGPSVNAASAATASNSPVAKHRGQQVCSIMAVVLGLVGEPLLRRVDYRTGDLRLHVDSVPKQGCRLATLERAVRLDRAVTGSGGFAYGRLVGGVCVGAWCCGQCGDGSHGGNAASAYSRNRADDL
jgi:hypothetical protein